MKKKDDQNKPRRRAHSADDRPRDKGAKRAERTAEKEKFRAEKASEREKARIIKASEKEKFRAERTAEKEKARVKRAAERRKNKKRRERLKAERAEQKEKLVAEKNRLSALRRERRKKVYAAIARKLSNRPEGFCGGNYGFVPRAELFVRGDGASVAAMLASADIRVAEMTVKGGEVALKIRKKDLRKAIAILDEMCYTYKIGCELGVVRSLLFWAARPGLIAGALLAAFGLDFMYSRVWRISVVGNERISVPAIEATLKGSGISVGCEKSDGLPRAAAAALGGMNGIVDASCEISGTTLYVRVLEAEDTVELAPTYAYAAAYDCVVTRVVVRSGTARVKRGDVVKRGDMLADGDVYSSTGELLYAGECDADVYGNVSLTFSARVPAVSVEYRRTGRSASRTVFRLFGCSAGKAISPYPTYETVARTVNYDVLIPLYVTSYTYYETAATEAVRDPDSIAKAFAEQKAEELRFEGDFDSSFSVTESEGGMYSVHLFLGGEALVSRRAERTGEADIEKAEKR